MALRAGPLPSTSRLHLLARSCPSRLIKCRHVASVADVGKVDRTSAGREGCRSGLSADVGILGEVPSTSARKNVACGLRFARHVASGACSMFSGDKTAADSTFGVVGGSWQGGSRRPARFLADRSVVPVVAVTAAPAERTSSVGTDQDTIRVRFAPSPTGNLHVGGARTALFNWLFARNQRGKFILRVEDTDLERSTRESEEAVLRDLRWLGLDWDEGPDCGGEYGPYRQSERTAIYREFAEKLVASGHAYYCFCTDEELDAMRKEAEAKKLPPKYSGKWAKATKEEVQAELAKDTPHTYRFRVPQDGKVSINDLVRGEVSWATDTLGDFIILRSNRQPVYNFCVAVDDAAMKISHVIRAEEHLPNTLRQVLIYQALGFKPPQFGHVSLILAPDRSKLSKRHGATSVGEFRGKGFLAEAMVNYLALLGWNDGTEEEIFAAENLVEKFSIDRITKSAAIFDLAKLGWMNGQHLRSRSVEELRQMLGERWVEAGILTRPDGPFVEDAVDLVKEGISVVSDCELALRALLSYPLQETITSDQAVSVIGDGLDEIVGVIVSAFDNGDLTAAVAGGHDTWKAWVKGVGKNLKRKGKRLFMPIRLALTGSMQGPDVGEILSMLQKAEGSGIFTEEGGALFVPLAKRVAELKTIDWSVIAEKHAPSAVTAVNQ